MTRRAAFSIVAAAVAGVAVLWIGGMAAAQALSQNSTATASAPLSSHVSPDPRATARAATSAAPHPSASAGDGWKPPSELLRPLRTGDRIPTESDLRSYIESASWLRSLSASEVDVWVAERTIEVRCMADKGFYDDPRTGSPLIALKHRDDPRARPVDPAARLAWAGDTGAGDAYRWQDAGCVGLSVHETGNDDAN